MLKLAHRGDWRNAPENSLDALRAACGLQHIDGVEFDVRLSADGVPVLSHDEDLRRVHGTDGRVRELNAEALKEVGVAMLEDVIGALPDSCFLDVELKEDIAAAAAAALLRRGSRPDRAVVSSFDPATLEGARDSLPWWPRWLISRVVDDHTLDEAERLGCAAVAAESGALSAQNVASVRERGISVVAWTITKPAAVARYDALGVDAVCLEGAALEP